MNLPSNGEKQLVIQLLFQTKFPRVSEASIVVNYATM